MRKVIIIATSVQRFFLLITGLLFCVLGCAREHVDIPTLDDHAAPMETHDEPVDVEVAFVQNLLPILTARCALAGCHVADGPHGLDFRTYESFVAGGEHGPVFIPGNAEESEVVEQIASGKMPPGGPPLTDTEIQLFKDWINQQEATDHVVQDEHDEHGDADDMDDEHDEDMGDDHHEDEDKGHDDDDDAHNDAADN